MNPESPKQPDPAESEAVDEWGVPDEQVDEPAADGQADEWGDAPVDQSALPLKRQAPSQSAVRIIGQEGSAEKDDAATDQDEEEVVVTQLQVREIKGKGLRARREELDLNKDLQRVPKKEVPQDSIKLAPRQTEDREWGKEKSLDWRWVIASGLVVILMVVGVLVMLPMLDKKGSVSQQQIREKAEAEYIEERKKLVEDLISRQGKAVQIYLDYASAPIVDEMLPLLRDSKRVEPMVRAWHSGATISKTWEPSSSFNWQVVSSEARPFGVLTGRLPNYDVFSAYFVMEGGDLYLDWEATVAYGTATFDELSKGLGNANKIRATLSPAVYYSMSYPEAEYHSFQLISADQNDMIWCYVKRGTPLERMIEKLFLGGDIIQKEIRPHKMTLALKRDVEGAAPNQWEIAGVWHVEWVSP